jgi:hypothetical protein
MEDVMIDRLGEEELHAEIQRVLDENRRALQ